MQFSKFLVAAAAFAAAQAVEFTNSAFNSITAGQPFNLTWTGASGAVTLTLKNGASTDLKTVSTIASGLTGTSYSWDVPSTLASDTYAIEITDSTGVPNYSTQFQLIGGASSSAAASSTSSGSSTGSSSTGSSSAGSSSTASSSLATITSTTASNLTTTSGSSSKTSSASKTTSSGSSSTGSRTTSATGSSSSTSAPSSASGLASPLAFVFLALAAFLTLN